MRNIIFETLIAAVMDAGLPADPSGKEVVYEAPVSIAEQLLPKPRVEILLTKAVVKPVNKKLAKYPTPGKETTYRTTRSVIDKVIQPVRLSIIAADEKQLEKIAHSLHTGLPRSLVDGHNNLIKVSVEAVESSGGGSHLVNVAVKTKLTKVYHLRFEGLVTTDNETAWIKDAKINVDYERGGDNNG